MNDRIGRMEKELMMMKIMRENLDNKEKEIKYHQDKVQEKEQVSSELCGKMSNLMIENHELKELLKKYQEKEKENNKKKGFFASIFG